MCDMAQKNESDGELSREMQLAWQFVEQTGTSVFLTGKAGTGKTTFLRYVKEHTSKTCVVTAPTGVAAINARGVTLHSFFQLPPTLFVPGATVKSNFRFSRNKLRIIRALDLLIIDEISMVRSDLLDAVDDTLRRLRRNPQPFGGVQLLMIGDLQQLAPVVTARDEELMQHYYSTPYFFGSRALAKINYVTVGLTKVFRQQNREFVSLLNHVRDGRLTGDDMRRLSTLFRPDFAPEPDQGYIRLTTHNRLADSYNDRQLAALPGKSSVYAGSITGDFPESFYPTDANLVLKKGAQVMFIRNDSSDEHRYYNGKIGVITNLTASSVRVRCIDDGTEVEVEKATWENTRYEINEADNSVKTIVDGTFSQIPLRLAWAITIHKSQGLTFNKAVIDAGRAFAPGQVYVALSRCRTLEGVVLATPLREAVMTPDRNVLDFISARTIQAAKDVSLINVTRALYRQRLLDRLFDFSRIGSALYSLRSFAGERLGKAGVSVAACIEESYREMQRDITDVAQRWRSAIANITDEVLESAAFQERYDKSIDYFRNRMVFTILEPLQALEKVKPSATLLAARWKELYEEFTGSVSEKMFLLKSMQGKPFTTDLFLKNRSKAVIESGSKKNAQKVKVSARKRPKRGQGSR